LIKPFNEGEVDGAVKKALARRAERLGTHGDVRTLLEHLRALAHASTAAADSQEVLQGASVMLQQVKQLMNASVVLLHVIDEPSRRLTCRICLGASMAQFAMSSAETWERLLRQTLRGHLPVVLSQGQRNGLVDGMLRVLERLGYQGGAFFPLVVGDEPLGVLSFLYQGLPTLRPDRIDIGRAVAELLAVSLSMHRRYHASQQDALQQAQRAAQLSILQEVSHVIVGTLDLADTLQAIGEQLQAGLGFAGFHVWLCERDGVQWSEAYGYGPDPGWHPGEGESDLPHEVRVERYGDAQVVLAPIAVEETTVGMIKLVRAPGEAPIAQVEIELITMLLESIGLAVKNSLLYGEIKETKRYLENLIHSAGDAIITVNKEDVVSAWNHSAERIFQYRAAEMLQQHIAGLFPRELYDEWRDEVQRQGGSKSFDAQLRRRDGMPMHVSLTLSPLLNARDELAGFSAIIRDVTEERQLRDRLLQSEKLSALGELAAGIAHNFNNILAAILGRAQLLARSPTDIEAVRRNVGIIEQAVADGVAMVQRIQKFARGSPESAFGPTDLNQLVRETIDATQIIWKDQALHQGNPIDVVMDLGRLPPVRSRSAELREVLTNLILNAVDAMPQGGRLTLRTERRGRVACIEVSDTGTGMAEEVKRRAFNPFFTTKGDRGTGLGLSISHALIKAHHGDIALQSEVGRGTTVVITLPIE
jgi:PAS domain S-box-containing protein